MGKNNGKDYSKLGRWVWSKYQGKNNKVLRIITVYMSCKTGRGGSRSTYNQQLRWLLKNNDEREPCNALIEDLAIKVENGELWETYSGDMRLKYRCDIQ